MHNTISPFYTLSFHATLLFSFYICQKLKLIVAPDLVAEIEAEMKTSM